MAIIADMHKGAYAFVVDGLFYSEQTKIINNANIISKGGCITAPFLGVQIVEVRLAMSITKKMEHKKEFLINAFKKVVELENENFKWGTGEEHE